jgi:drug/metabolite transporter (DMT)-like permease
MSDATVARYALGALYGVAAVSIWAGWIVVARFGLKTALTPWDIAALRFGVAGLLLLPYLLRQGLALDRLGWGGLAVIVIGGGAPVLLANVGLLFAPAAHAGALFPGVMPLFVAGLAAAILSEAFTAKKSVGCVLILGGVTAIVWGTGGTLGEGQNIGHILFLGSALAWAGYTVALRGARLGGLHAAAIAAVGGMAICLPLYLLMAGTTILAAPLADIAIQAFVQGVLTAIVSLLLYGRAVALLGASSGAAFAALCPALTALLGIPLLGEWPKPLEWAAVAAVSIGVYFVSGGPFPKVRHGAGP